MKILFFYVFLVFVACDSAEQKTTSDVIARVGDETLTKKDLLLLTGNQAGGIDVFSRAINNWVEKKLLYRAALSIGLHKDLALTKKRDLFYESLLISSFVDIQTKANIKITKKDVSDYYLNNKNSFVRIDEEVLVKHFAFQTNKAAKKTIKELKKKKPKIDMKELLKDQRVETKTITKRGAGSNHIDFVFAGGVGDILGPKKFGGFFHVFQILQKHKEGSYIGLEKVYEEIYQRLYKEKEFLVLGDVLDSLYLNSDVFVSRETLEQ